MAILINSGRDIEMKFFGCAADFRTWRPPRKHFWSAVRSVRKHQPAGWDPHQPKTDLARQFLEKVGSRLLPTYGGGVELYCALNSTLDFYYGIDGFFQVPHDGNPVILTFDLTMKNRPSKLRDRKANIKLRSRDLENNLQTLSDVVAHELLKKMRKMR